MDRSLPSPKRAHAVMAAWLAAASLAVAAAPAPGAAQSGSGEDGGSCRRVVSLSPNVTEILFAVGLGDRIVGVTRFCEYPEKARHLPRVGGYFDTNLEAVVALEPDCVVLLPVHEQVRATLERLGIGHLTVRNETVGDILSSITAIGERCGAADSAASVRRALEERIERVRRLTAGRSRPSALVVVSRAYGAAPTDLCAAAAGTFYDDLLAAAGGRNVLLAGAPAYPELSMEGLLRLDPDLIIDIVPDADDRGLDRSGLEADWMGLPQLRAVREGRIVVLTGDHAAIPGPRLVLLLEELAAALHPDLTGIGARE